MHLSFLDVLPFWDSSGLDPKVAIFESVTMPLLRPGIDVAVHTEFKMLSTAAWWDFKQHIIRVQARGDRVATLRLWQSVGMVCIFPRKNGESAFEVPGLPPILLLPCTEDQCQRCRDRVGGFRFSWIGIWTRRHEMVRVPPLFGTDTIDTLMSSISWASRWRAAAGCSGTWPRPRYGLWPTRFVAGRIHGTEQMVFLRQTPFSLLSCGSYHCPPWCSLCSFCKVLWGSALGDSWTGCPHRVSDHDAKSICLSGGEA